MRRLGGGFEAVNVTPRDLILVAFDVPRFAIADLPSWAESERFDVSARADTSRPPAPANADMPMLRTLLEDRFRRFSKGVGRVISGFVLFLSSQVRRPVIDRTGLTGTWDIDLTFNPDSPDDPRPSLFTHCRYSSVCGSNRRARRCRCSSSIGSSGQPRTDMA
jgi:hypothetical protein